jgi:hypothetical protein
MAGAGAPASVTVIERPARGKKIGGRMLASRSRTLDGHSKQHQHRLAQRSDVSRWSLAIHFIGQIACQARQRYANQFNV